MIDQPKPKPADWKAQVTAAYHASVDHWAAALLARSGIPADRATLDFQTDYHVYATVDGERFRLVRGLFGIGDGPFGPHLLLVRPCRACGQGGFVSAWVDSPAALGAALGTFRPLCSACRRAGRG